MLLQTAATGTKEVWRIGSAVPGTPADSRSVLFNDFDTQIRYLFRVDSAMDVSINTRSAKSRESEATHPLENSGKATRGLSISGRAPHSENSSQCDLNDSCCPLKRILLLAPLLSKTSLSRTSWSPTSHWTIEKRRRSWSLDTERIPETFRVMAVTGLVPD
jgi:hypothetical protein